MKKEPRILQTLTFPVDDDFLRVDVLSHAGRIGLRAHIKTPRQERVYHEEILPLLTDNLGG